MRQAVVVAVLALAPIGWAPDAAQRNASFDYPQATPAPAQAQPPQTPNPAPSTAPAGRLTFLEPLVGKNVGDTKVFDHPTMKSRLTAAMGKDAALVRERFQTAGDVEKEGPIVFMGGNKAHSGGTDSALIVADLKRDDLWVWLTVGGNLRRFGPQDDPAPMPRDAATMLKNMKTR